MKSMKLKQRGAVLLTAMIFALIVAIALSSYVHMTTTTLKMSHRAFLTSDAMNVCEAGLERGLWVFNQVVTTGAAPATAWSGWATGASSSDRAQTFNGFALSQGATGSVKVYVENYNPATTAVIPVIVAEATVVPASGPAIKKVIKAELTRRSLFGKGGVARSGFTFSGTNPTADSWNSKYDDTGVLRGTPAAYVGTGTGANRHDKVSIAALNADVDVGNADIYGTVSVGGTNLSNVDVGPNGRIGPFGTANGVIDPNSVAQNFSLDLPNQYDPTGYVPNPIGAITSTTTLPLPGATASPDGKIYYVTSDVSLIGNTASSQLTVSAGYTVVIVSTNGVTVGGNGALTVEVGGKVEIYTAGDITVTGSIINLNGSAYSDSVSIFGTNNSSPLGTQDIKLSGNGTLCAVVNAPNADIEAKGGGSGSGGDIYGSFVGNAVTFTGNSSFHYDESLKDNIAGGTYQPSKWRELVSAADRALYTTQFGYAP
jgi:hypothetical protein